MEKKKYPIGPENYTLYEEIGQGVSASVYRALCIPIDEIVAIKILDFERGNCDLNSVSREAQIMNLVDHANVLRSHCSFVCDHNLWVVMPYMAGGSCLHILKAAYPHGFEEVVIATILREVLKGLEYLHDHGHIHRDVKAGNILIDSKGAIKLGDFGVSACLFDSGDRQRVRNTFVGTPCWMAPEVMAQLHGYDFKADIWSFGITALELAHGHAPFSKYPPMKVLLMTLQNAPPGLDYERDKKFSKSFKQMIAICLVKDPSKRPTAKKLLKHSFFKQARSNDHLSRKLLEGLPALGDRIKALKQKEEDMLAQEKMPDGEKEELSQNKYKRGISGWNFNLEDVKAQAALIPDDDVIYDKDQGGGSSSQISDNEENELVTYRPSTLPLEVSNGNLFKSRGEKWDEEASVSTSSNQEHPPSESSSPPLGDQQHGECINVPLESPDKECSAKKSVISNSSASALPLHRRRVSSAACTYMVEIPPPSRVESFKSSMQTLQSSDGGTSCHAGDDTLLETPPKSSKDSSDLITGNNEEVEEKKKIQVVQQKGRFKVTSENLDMEKVGPTPLLQKSHSMQVISQQGTTMVSSSPYEAPSSHVIADSFFPMLQTFLQTNITQRESILNMMKQVASGDFPGNRIGNGGCTYANIAEIERSLLEAAHDREKELLHDVTELQWRLICAQEAIQKLKTESSGTNP